jgi:large subunit ribosomal protein L44e
MKFPKELNIYCPYCNKHTPHTVEVSKRRPRGKMTHGNRIFQRKLKGYTSFPREKPDYEKSTKRVDLRFKCTVCGKKTVHGRGWRVKKFELVKK